MSFNYNLQVMIKLLLIIINVTFIFLFHQHYLSEDKRLLAKEILNFEYELRQGKVCKRDEEINYNNRKKRIWGVSARCVIVMTILLCSRWLQRKKIKAKSKYSKSNKYIRPISILLYAYPPEHYKIETGSTRS